MDSQAEQMTVREAAVTAGVTRQAILAAIARGKLRGQREGDGTRADVLIARSDFEAWQAARSGLKRGPKGPRVQLFSKIVLCGGAKPPQSDVHEFTTWDDAWVYCRSQDAPVVVRINEGVYKLYPNGAFEKELGHAME